MVAVLIIYDHQLTAPWPDYKYHWFWSKFFCVMSNCSKHLFTLQCIEICSLRSQIRYVNIYSDISMVLRRNTSSSDLMLTMVSNVWSRRRGNGLRNTVTIGENKTCYNIVVCFRNSYMIHSEQHISNDRQISNLIYETWYLWKKTISTEVEYIDTDGTCYQGESCVIQSEVPGITGEHPCTIESYPKSCLQFATPYGLPVICFYPWRNDGKEMFST